MCVMFEMFLLIALFVGFYSEQPVAYSKHSQVNQLVVSATNQLETGTINQLENNSINQLETIATNQFEIINKNGIWVLAPVKAKNTNRLKIKPQNTNNLKPKPFTEFIVLPDGSKIQKGL